jgi:hypothetical protein
MFLIPQIFHGQMSDVRKRVSKALNQYLKGVDLDTALKTDEMVNPFEDDSLIFLDFGHPSYSRVQDFHVTYLVNEAMKLKFKGKMSQQNIDTLFYYLLGSSWGLLCLLPRVNIQEMLDEPQKYVDFINACIKFWPDLRDSKPIFTYGTNVTRSLWGIASGFGYALARAGVPMSALEHEPESIGDLVPPDLTPKLFEKWIGQ